MKETKFYSNVECDIFTNITKDFALDDRPVVTVSVTAYNSSKYILETLESIKEQTYKNLILQISDDCSNDNTIEICKKWIVENQKRFVKTKIIIPHQNTGVSANCNRAWDECETEWFKGIAGDDLLLPDCIDIYMDYIINHSDVVLVFGRAMSFSTVKSMRIYGGYVHDYDYFKLSTKDLHYKLIWEGNKLPAASAFHNVKILRSLGFLHDTRIRNIEDYPKWINLSKVGIRFHFVNKDTVLYRREETSLSVGLFSPNYYKQELLLCLYYYLDEIKSEEDREKIYNLIAEHCTYFYEIPYVRASNSIEYKIGCFLLKPIRLIKKSLKYLKDTIKIRN